MTAPRKTARGWKYPFDEPLRCPAHVFFPRQKLMICANPEPENRALPWAVILEDGVTMYDLESLTFSGMAIAKTDWKADNYWYPRMWIEVIGELTIHGAEGRVERAGRGDTGAGK